MFPLRQATPGMNPGAGLFGAGSPAGGFPPMSGPGLFGPGMASPFGTSGLGTRGAGGLSRLLGGLFNSGSGAQTGGMPFGGMAPGFGTPGFGGLATGGAGGLANPGLTGTGSSGGLLGIFQNLQKMVGVAQQVMPVIQQISPMIKNLPGLINMARTMMELRKSGDQSAATDDSSNENTGTKAEERASRVEIEEFSKGEEKEDTPKTRGPSRSHKQKRRPIPTQSQTTARSTVRLSPNSSMGYQPVPKITSQPTLYV
ncbi:VrrA/YqfQ family protein [Tuberibacillus calidus]|uniref:VrrA/YqfQ family protein n=1 Tax=Tuberibacillus calidus TaxID=340097 RepID=UPI0003F5D788|nr:VrrA/YqfQ family protein [Tuberibacillus calidus]